MKIRSDVKPTPSTLDNKTPKVPLSEDARSTVQQSDHALAMDVVEPAVDFSAFAQLLESGLVDTKSFKMTCGDYNL